ncbi:MAG: arginine-tRNA-protein transferase [Lewinellaceae bacterium]|nr:arginine-tRNA-protein transferase [Lewinellaceae bacterium]
MFTEKLYLDHLPPALLDHYLAKGWYRMGQSMFTCRFLMFQGQLFPAVWVRMPLAQYAFSKKLRKLYNRNANRFQVVTRPGKINMEKERLYQKYRKHFPGRLAPSLKVSLLDDGNVNLFNTYETCIYDGPELVGFSFFDLGKDSLASILGVYHPDYKKHSLGFFTMLLEISFGLENGYSYYYPGYIVPGYAKFDYKTRIGPVECFDEKSQQWIPKQEFPFEDLPTRRMEQALLEVKGYLDEWSIPNNLVLYPPYEANLIGYWILDYLEYPMLLECVSTTLPAPGRMVVAYDTIRDSFLLYQCSVYDDLSDFFHSSLLDSTTNMPLQLELLIKDELLAEVSSGKEMARIIAEQERED